MSAHRGRRNDVAAFIDQHLDRDSAAGPNGLSCRRISRFRKAGGFTIEHATGDLLRYDLLWRRWRRRSVATRFAGTLVGTANTGIAARSAGVYRTRISRRRGIGRTEI